MPDPTLYLFDGYNLLHAGDYADRRRLCDELASFVALKGTRGIVVFDGAGEDERRGALEVRYAAHADSVLERLAAEHRQTERVCVVTSDTTVMGTSGQEVSKVSSSVFVRELQPARHAEAGGSRVGERVDEATRERLERLRRGDP